MNILNHIIDSSDWIRHFGIECNWFKCVKRPYTVPFMNRKAIEAAFHCKICFICIIILRIFIRPFIRLMGDTC